MTKNIVKKAPPKKKVSTKKVKAKMQDGGLGPAEIAKIRQANRQLWQRSSLARKMVVDRCLLPDGFSQCEECNVICPKVAVDHTDKVGLVDSGYLERLWVSSEKMKGLCKSCHDKKTALERKEDKLMAKKKEYDGAVIPFDPDIDAMDLYAHEKLKLQVDRNEKRKHNYNLDDYLGMVITTVKEESIEDLF